MLCIFSDTFQHAKDSDNSYFIEVDYSRFLIKKKYYEKWEMHFLQSKRIIYYTTSKFFKVKQYQKKI